MKVKICGICRAEDARYVSQAGADYLGIILARRGPRSQTLENADLIVRAASGPQRVGVFADQTVKEIVEACERLKLDVVQLHGHESPAFVAEVQRSMSCFVWKAISLGEAGDLERAADLYGDVVNGLLFDGPRAGSGTAFNWNLAANARATIPSNVDLIIAGGLTADNVGEAIANTQPDVVDVASGVEENVCAKSKERIDRFIRNAVR